MKIFRKNIVDKNQAQQFLITGILAVLFVLSLASFAYANYRVGSEPWQIVLSSILLSVPLLLLYFSIGVLIFAAGQKRKNGKISDRLAKYIYWTPRIAGVLIIIFVGMFSLDVFSEGGDPLVMLGGFIIHSIPSIILGTVLAIAWRRDIVGFIVFMGAALFFMRFLLGNPVQGFGTFLLFSGPMTVIALLFLANEKWLKPQRK